MVLQPGNATAALMVVKSAPPALLTLQVGPVMTPPEAPVTDSANRKVTASAAVNKRRPLRSAQSAAVHTSPANCLKVVSIITSFIV